MFSAINVIVKGKVQGVGFRPFVYALSKKHQLNGTVQNNIDRVNIILEGEKQQITKMLKELELSPPKLAKINEIHIYETQPVYYKDFSIIQSEINTEASVTSITLDAAICKECLEEMRDPLNRRFQYPFINCTQCGPRYTIINRLPYDRPNTTMSAFSMCTACQVEYNNPLNRRHHAQPICCAECGPTLTLLNKKGELLAENHTAVLKTIELIQHGEIIAIKGLGGYHLACDAYQEKAVNRLRLRKQRPQQPFAIMVKSLEIAKSLCHITVDEEKILTSSAMPIAVLHKKTDCALPEIIAPDLTTLGIMLPYTPLHHLLFEGNDVECLIMTSANPSGFPIQYKDTDLTNLQEICDYILTHNREIVHPIDDSVVQLDERKLLFYRRARGFAPEVFTTNSTVSNIVALGGNQKNTFAIGKQNQIILSPYIGDLKNEEMNQYFEEQLKQYSKWYEVDIKNVAIDKHPSYSTTIFAKNYNCNIIQIQHHHAHHVSCIEDNHLDEPCLGIILDGTGYGDDGHIWGFEFLYGDANFYQRLGHLKYTPLPGGEKAVKEPWRNAVGMILSYWPNEGRKWLAKLFPEKLFEINIIEQMIAKQINTPMAGTCGRLFDAVSAILGICMTSTYEGEPAIKLADKMNHEQVENSSTTYPYQIIPTIHNQLELDFSPMIYQIIQEKLLQKPLNPMIQKFHRTIVSSCVDMTLKIINNNPHLSRTLVLSGGTFQNNYLRKEIQRQLEHKEFNVYTHKNIPCHDGGLAFGQMIIAAKAISK